MKVNQNVKFTKTNFDLKIFFLKLKVAEFETIVGGGLHSTSAVPLVLNIIITRAPLLQEYLLFQLTMALSNTPNANAVFLQETIKNSLRNSPQ